MDLSTASEQAWMLPQGIDELLPPQAWAVEMLRRRILDHYWRCGYELVQPPHIEYIESLLVGTGHSLDLQTFKLIDQLTGRTLGVRADMTPQVARIDAHRLQRDTPTRLCYLGTVLRTRPDEFADARSPLQLGAELYGHQGVESDAEVLSLMLETLQLAGVGSAYVDLGHVGILRSLAAQARLDERQIDTLFAMLQRKSQPEVSAFVASIDCTERLRTALLALLDLHGDGEILAQARVQLDDSDTQVCAAIDHLQALAAWLSKRFPATPLHFDLAELHGYQYHTGVVFTAYTPGHGQEIARGGRYDDIGRAFGRARPATGFSTDLKRLSQEAIAGAGQESDAYSIFADAPQCASHWQVIESLRAKGHRVFCHLPGQDGGAAQMNCSHRLRFSGAEWRLITSEKHG